LRTSTVPTTDRMVSEFSKLVFRHDAWRGRRCINLQPSENILSPAVRKLLSTDMASRYTLPSNEFISNGGAPNSYGGTRYMDEVERKGEEIARELFSAEYVSLRPLSGHIASLLMLASVCRKGDTIMAVSSADGGYDGYGQPYVPDMLSLRSEPIPFDRENFNLDIERATSEINRIKPRLVILGQSFFLFPYGMKAVRDACSDAGALLGYDGSHVLGLIAGGQFQRPLEEGADVLIGSTHKSFPGPQGGIFATNNDEIWKAFLKNTTWRLIDNAHWNRIAALSQALLEMKRFGRQYAQRVINNARSLGDFLEDVLPCRYRQLGYSRSHQLLIDGEELRSRGLSFHTLSSKLEANDIIIDTTGRLGTAEVSRLGMGQREMREIASFINEVLQGKTVRDKANKLRRSFNIMYV